MDKRVAIGTDHGGYSLKEEIKKFLSKSGYKVKDVGTNSGDSCDYPEFGFKVAQEVSAGKVKRGIVICKSGIGMSIVANKLPGVRAGLCGTVKDAVSAREHNDTNILVLAAAKLPKKKAMEITETWLKTKTLKGRHARRVKQIKDFEKKVFKLAKKGKK